MGSVSDLRLVLIGVSAAFLSIFGSAAAVSQELQFDERPALPFFPPEPVIVQSQCGAVNDLQDVERYDGTLGVTAEFVQKHQLTTVQLQWLDEASIRSRLPEFTPGNVAGQRWCSGTLFTDRLVLTAGHCFDVQTGNLGWVSPFKIGPDGKPQRADSTVIATLQVANFGYQKDKVTGAIRIPAVYPIAKLVEYRLGDLDYSIVELAPDAAGKLPGDSVPPATIPLQAPTIGETLAIIQHPQGQPKKIGAGRLLQVSGSSVFYNDIDTWGGSSGSGVLDENGNVIGVHTNGGCTVDPALGANRGVDVRAIAAVSDKF